MRIAGLQTDGPTLVATLCGVCVFMLVALVGVNAVEATHDPVVQATPELTTSADKVEIKSDSQSNPEVLSKEERRTKAFQERRQIVLDFLEQHFPELQKSILKSEEKSQRKFKGAVSRLAKDIVHLKSLEKNQPERFELMVKQWRLKTQIEITIAKYAKKESDAELEERLSPLVGEMLDIRKSILKLDRQAVTKRLSSIDKNLLNLENKRARAMEKNLNRLKKSADQVRAKQKARLLLRQSEKNETKPASDPQPADKKN